MPREAQTANVAGDGINVPAIAGTPAVAGADVPHDAQPLAPRQTPRHPPREQQPRANRGGDAQRQDSQGNSGSTGGNPGSNGSNRQDALREERDNRGNRDTTQRNPRNVVRDDDFGNRMPPVKQLRGIRARIAAGDIDEELDNIGNRMPPLPKHQRDLDSEDEINFNVAAPAQQTVFDDHDEQQPPSNAGQMFPSSAGFMGDGRPARGRRGNGGTGSKRWRQGQRAQSRH